MYKLHEIWPVDVPMRFQEMGKWPFTVIDKAYQLGSIFEADYLRAVQVALDYRHL
jgi:hypothetical protein